MQPETYYNEFLAICKRFSTAIFNKDGNVPRRGPKPKASDLEILALSLLQSYLGIESESYFFAIIGRRLPELAARVGTRRNYNERRKSMYRAAETVRCRMVEAMRGANPERIFVIDSMPIESCRFARAKNSAIFRESFSTAPNYGYCAAHKTYYFGYKLHAVCTPDGVVEYYDITPANVSDICMLPEVKERFGDCLLLGDTGYLNRDAAMDLFDYAGIELLVPYRGNMKERPSLPAGFGPVRKRVEVLFSQLVDQGGMRKNYAKRQKGLFGRIVSKMCLFTLLQYINFVKGKPISRIRYTLVA